MHTLQRVRVIILKLACACHACLKLPLSCTVYGHAYAQFWLIVVYDAITSSLIGRMECCMGNFFAALLNPNVHKKHSSCMTSVIAIIKKFYTLKTVASNLNLYF